MRDPSEDMREAGLTDRRVAGLLAALVKPRAESSLLTSGPTLAQLRALEAAGVIASRPDALGQGRVWYRTGRGVGALGFLMLYGVISQADLVEFGEE